MVDRLGDLKSDAIISTGIIVLMLIVMVFFTGTYVVAPVGRLLTAIDHVTHGKLEERVEINQNDETGKLAENFNAMAEQLEQSFKRLKNWNVELESEVACQTLKIRSMSDYYQAVIDSTQRIIVTTNLELVIDSINAEWEDQSSKYDINLSRNELVGKIFYRLFLRLEDHHMKRSVARSLIWNTVQKII